MRKKQYIIILGCAMMIAFSGCGSVFETADSDEEVTQASETDEDDTDVSDETEVDEKEINKTDEDGEATEALEDDATGEDAAAGEAWADSTTADKAGADDTASDSKDKERKTYEGQEIVDAALELNVTTLDGEVIPIKDLIKDKKVVMLNEWGTFCGPCINEMSGLGELAREYKDQGFEIIGLTVDLVDYDGNIQQSAVQDAKDIIDDTGVTYPVVSMPLEMIDYLNTGYVPTTIFVDGNGRMLEEVMISSREKSDWEIIIKELLANAE